MKRGTLQNYTLANDKVRKLKILKSFVFATAAEFLFDLDCALNGNNNHDKKRNNNFNPLYSLTQNSNHVMWLYIFPESVDEIPMCEVMKSNAFKVCFLSVTN